LRRRGSGTGLGRPRPDPMSLLRLVAFIAGQSRQLEPIVGANEPKAKSVIQRRRRDLKASCPSRTRRFHQSCCKINVMTLLIAHVMCRDIAVWQCTDTKHPSPASMVWAAALFTSCSQPVVLEDQGGRQGGPQARLEIENGVPSRDMPSRATLVRNVALHLQRARESEGRGSRERHGHVRSTSASFTSPQAKRPLQARCANVRRRRE
jgi:hypothetical protein